MNPDYCNSNEFEKAVDFNDIRYYRPEDDRFNAVKIIDQAKLLTLMTDKP